MSPPLLSHVVGARPNFMKAAPVLMALRKLRCCDQQLVHTGQHYDPEMSQIFFRELQLPEPDVNLGVGSGSHARQTAAAMVGLDGYLMETQPKLVLVYGDVNSTLAAALVCSKLGIPFAHVEAGLRSFDRSMPEEVNRVVTDQLADLLFTPSPEADANLAREGVAAEKVHRVGNVMIDTLNRLLPRALERWPAVLRGLEESAFVVVTLHRPSNVDDGRRLKEIAEALTRLARLAPVVFPVHPRTREKVAAVLHADHGVRLMDPLGYLDFLALQSRARLVITDSGGIQEETTVLGVSCLTLRDTTERPVTVSEGTNRLIGTDSDLLVGEARKILDGPPRERRSVPQLWDGRSSQRIARILKVWLDQNLSGSGEASSGC